MPLKAKVYGKVDMAGEGPFLASFPDGLPELHSTRFTMFEDGKSDRVDRKRALKGVSNTAEFYGGNFGSTRNQAKHATNVYMIGVVTKNKKCKLMKVDSIYEMGFKVAETTHHVDTTDSDEELDYETQKSQMINAFGSKKGKKTLRLEKTNRVTVEDDSLLQHSIGLVAASVMTKDDAMPLAQVAEAAGLIPEVDVDTKIPELVYPLASKLSKEARANLNEMEEREESRKMYLMGGRLLGQLTQDAQIIVPLLHKDHAFKSNDVQDTYGAFLHSAFQKCRADIAMKNYRPKSKHPSDGKRLEYAKIASYFVVLRKVYLLRTKQTYKFHQMEEKYGFMNRTVTRIILDRFFEKDLRNGHTYTMAMQQRVLCHLLLLCLKMRDAHLSESDVKLLGKDLKMDPAKINNMLRMIGCKQLAMSESGKSSGGYTLVAPLNLPKVSTRKRKRR